ncbi:MAG: Ig-like domain-containing protein [Candidatus Thermoplasmatota archaeon]|nr:Ig-like domain-containing protein [Candidatus Thermoplasmatota archaeon]
MRGVCSVLLLTLLVLALAQPLAPAPTLDEAQGPSSSTSSLALAFSGPSEGESITGLLSVTVTATGTGTLSWVRIDVSDGSGWSEVGNRSSGPWFAQLDTTTLTNGSYQLRAVGLDADVDDEVTGFSPNFTVANQVPVISAFSVLNPGAGNGTSSNDRWWFATPANGTLQFRWGASDDDLERATLSNVPGTGNPASDGPGTLAYGWDWTPGDLTEGTWNPRLNVLDGSGLTASLTRFIGIDRTGPDIGAITVGSSGGWQMDEDITLSGIKSTADDGFGSGVAFTEYSLDGQSWQSTTADSLELTLPEGQNTVRLRSVDRVGNVGPVTELPVNVDLTPPEGYGWVVEELTTNRVDPAPIRYVAEDLGSGVDHNASTIEYGFDTNGVGSIPDITGRWITLGNNAGLNTTLDLASWATKSGQYLLLRATVVDGAGNAIVTPAASFQVLPGLDMMWNATNTTIDRLIVRPGQATGGVQIESTIDANEGYDGTVVVRLETAPADRFAAVDWTVMESRTLPAGSLSNGTHSMTWNLTVTLQGQLDIRVVIDPSDTIDEYNEGNNAIHFVVTGATISPGLVPSFAPSIGLLLLAGLLCGVLARRPRD